MTIKLTVRRTKTVSARQKLMKKTENHKKSKTSCKKTAKKKVLGRVRKTMKKKFQLMRRIRISQKIKIVKGVGKAKALPMNPFENVVKTSVSVSPTKKRNFRISPGIKYIKNEIQGKGLSIINQFKKLVKRKAHQGLKSPYQVVGSSEDRTEAPLSKRAVVLTAKEQNQGVNGYTGAESLGTVVTHLCLSKLSRNHYYEIQEVYCNLQNGSNVITLTDVGLFDNFGTAREFFIQYVFDKIEDGCTPARSDKFSCSWLRDSINSSSNSLFGYWFRLKDSENGLCEISLRKKKWSPLCGDKLLSPSQM